MMNTTEQGMDRFYVDAEQAFGQSGLETDTRMRFLGACGELSGQMVLLHTSL